VERCTDLGAGLVVCTLAFRTRADADAFLFSEGGARERGGMKTARKRKERQRGRERRKGSRASPRDSFPPPSSPRKSSRVSEQLRDDGFSPSFFLLCTLEIWRREVLPLMNFHYVSPPDTPKRRFARKHGGRLAHLRFRTPFPPNRGLSRHSTHLPQLTTVVHALHRHLCRTTFSERRTRTAARSADVRPGRRVGNAEGRIPTANRRSAESSSLPSSPHGG
jgi:hypothetical protein